MKSVQWTLVAVVSVGTMCLTSSCFLSKPVPYFQGGLDTSRVQGVLIPEQLIQKGDILNITVYSDNPQATAIFNQASGSSATSTVSTTAGSQVNPASAVMNASSGYLVDNAGNVRMHALGVLYVEGLTRAQATLDQIAALETGDLATLSVALRVLRNLVAQGQGQSWSSGG